MKAPKIIFLGLVILMIIASLFAKAQTTVQVGNFSNIANYLPIVANYNFSYSQQIYPSAEIGYPTGGTISQIRFWWVSPPSFEPTADGTPVTNWNNWTVYLGNTTLNSFSGTWPWIPTTQMSQVFSGTFSPTINGWVTLNLTSPFVYTGGNLVVAVDENAPSMSSGAYWLTYPLYTSIGSRCILYYSNTINPDPNSPPQPNFNDQTYRSTFQFDISCAGTPNSPVAYFNGSPGINSSDICAGETKTMAANGFSTSPGITNQWKVSNTSGGPYTNVTGGAGATTGTYTTQSLTAGTYYYVCTSTCTASGQTSTSNQITLTVNPLPNVSISTSNGGAFCGTQLMTSSGASTYTWSPATSLNITTGSSVYFTGTANTTINVTGIGANGCVNTSSLAVTYTSPTPITLSSSVPNFCGTGGTTTISASSSVPYVYTFESIDGALLSNITSTTVNATVDSTSAIRVIGYNAATGCTAQAVYSVGVYPLPSANLTTAYSIVCPGVVANINSALNAVNYSVNSIPFVPYTIPASATTVVSNGAVVPPYALSGNYDDGGFAGIPIGFSFNYFGTTQTTIAAGTNGLIMFGTPACFSTAAGCLGQNSFNTVPAVFPNPNNPKNAIALMGGNQYFAGATNGNATIKYWIEGYAPNRKFVLLYQNVPAWPSASMAKFTAYLSLYETIGVIDIHIQSKLNTNACTVGLQNESGTLGSIAPGRQNFTEIISTPEAWRFSPPDNYTTSWSATDANGMYILTNNADNSLINSINDFDISVTPEISTNYAISLQDINTGCSNVSSPDELTIQVHEVTVPNFSIQSYGCPGSTMPISEFTALNGSSYFWNVSPNAETIVNTSNLLSPSITFANEGLYTVEIIAIDSQGCLTNSSTQNVSISSNLLLDSLSSISVCIGGNPNQLCVNYNNGPGTSYFQWYEDINNDLIGGTPLLGETYSCFTPSSTNESTSYYYATVLIDGGSCSGITSNAAEIKITSPPLISSQPISNQTICLSGVSATLSVSLQTLTGIGPFSYQWYSNTFASNTDGIPIQGANGSSFNPSQFNSIGSYYFYCIVNDPGNGCGTVISEVSCITVIEDPFISSQPIQMQTLCQNGNPEMLEITAVGWTFFTYQWYVNSTNSYSGATIIPDATLSSYLPQTNIVGTNYYFCVISIPNLNSCSLLYSNISALNVQLSAYIIASTDSPQTVCIGGNTTNISFSVPDGFETPTYQWFSNINYQYSNATILSNENTSVYSPPSNSEGTIYYFCELLFSSNSACGSINTPITEVTVFPDPSISIQPLSTQTICEGGQNQIQTLTVSSIGQPAGVSYQWYQIPNMACANGNYSQYTPNPNNSGLFNYYVEIYSTMEGCDMLTSNNSELIISPDPIISAEQNFFQTLCPFDEDIYAPTVLLDFDNSIGPPTYTWIQVEEGVHIPLANSNQNSYLPQLPMNGEFNSQCMIQFEYPGCDVLTSSLSALTFDENNLNCFPELIIPEAISPNNDGMNDYWVIKGIELFNGYEINIFNGFGQSICFVKNTPPNWDGTWNGRTLPNGDYFFSVKLDELNRTLFGTISLAK